MTDLRRVYVAGPYTHGDVAVNVREAWLAGHAIHQAGHLAFVPHLYHFAHFLTPQSYVEWCALDLKWLQACDCVVRLPGYSPGSDREVEAAKVLGMPVYYTLAACLNDLPPRKGVTL